MKRISIVISMAACVGVLSGITPLLAQSAVPESALKQKFDGPKVGDEAPDFTFKGTTRYGPLRDAMKLSDLRGQIVVIAFFPGARTPGCAIQMEKYRDSYSSTFANGKDLVLIGVSSDADTTLSSWAKEANFPMLFVSDTKGDFGSKYGAFDQRFKLNHRLLYVIAPDGKVAYVAKPFNVSTAESYKELADAIKLAAPSKK